MHWRWHIFLSFNQVEHQLSTLTSVNWLKRKNILKWYNFYPKNKYLNSHISSLIAAIIICALLFLWTSILIYNVTFSLNHSLRVFHFDTLNQYNDKDLLLIFAKLTRLDSHYLWCKINAKISNDDTLHQQILSRIHFEFQNHLTWKPSNLNYPKGV